jgi:ADP-heptose:LPS heptosyltransferase
MNTLILKLGATGDVVRTTPIIPKLSGQITWVTASKNVSLLQNTKENLRCLAWEQRNLVPDITYDLIINLEDTIEVGMFCQTLKAKELFGAFLDSNNSLGYTENSRNWFDLSLISRFGLAEADKLKHLNRRTYQDLIFEGLGWQFAGEKYLLPEPVETGTAGDVAISAECGPVWPMKHWAFYGDLQRELQSRGLTVNVLGKRASLLEHLADVRNHRCLVGGDSLPMHFALGTGTRCVTIFNCTSPWEIYDYGLQKKIVSPLLSEYFYQRNNDLRATTAVSLESVLHAVMSQLEVPSSVAK